MNHFLSIIRLDILLKYSLRNDTNFSGENFSDTLVNHSISEKNIVTFLFSQSKFIFHDQDNISAAISLDTYSERALFNFHFCLFSIRYLTIFDIVKDNISEKINSAE